MRLLLIIAIVCASLCFTCGVEAADVSGEHCHHGEINSHPEHNGQENTTHDSSVPCHDCCLHHAAQLLPFFKADVDAIASAGFTLGADAELDGLHPPDLLRPPRTV